MRNLHGHNKLFFNFNIFLNMSFGWKSWFWFLFFSAACSNPRVSLLLFPGFLRMTIASYYDARLRFSIRIIISRDSGFGNSSRDTIAQRQFAELPGRLYNNIIVKSFPSFSTSISWTLAYSLRPYGSRDITYWGRELGNSK